MRICLHGNFAALLWPTAVPHPSDFWQCLCASFQVPLAAHGHPAYCSHPRIVLPTQSHTLCLSLLYPCLCAAALVGHQKSSGGTLFFPTMGNGMGSHFPPFWPLALQLQRQGALLRQVGHTGGNLGATEPVCYGGTELLLLFG